MQYTVGLFATRPVVTVDVDTAFTDALKLMSKHRISCVVVLEDGEAIGILTERDIVFASNWVLGQPKLTVRDVMNKPVLTVPEDTSIHKAYEIFAEHNIRHLIVLDDKLNMGGVFTQTDLVRALRGQIFEGVDDISTLMTSQVLHVPPQVSARYALSQMARRAVSCVVVHDGALPVGVFTERDVVRLIAEEVDLDQITVGQVMSASLLTAPSKMAPSSAIQLMQKHSVRRLVVVNECSEMVGILTQSDLGRIVEHFVLPTVEQFPPQLSVTGDDDQRNCV
ncbi:MAG: CBS domain-containing protein [Deltaproteobacteria bacterium]|jgi:CBS domain-containing protein|nr:CBS domain-containing protein [Deltaproteobacteria bacterium]